MNYYTVRLIAFHDISEWIKENNITVWDEHGDILTVTPNQMHTKHTKYLNRMLGINRINYIGCKNGWKIEDTFINLNNQ